MTDTLQSLLDEACEYRGRVVHALVLRTWIAALDSVRGPTPTELEGCGDSSCVVAPPKGMATNGGCSCDEVKLRRAVQVLKNQRQQMLAERAPDPKTAEI